MEVCDQFTICDLGTRRMHTQDGCVFMWGYGQSIEDRSREPKVLGGFVELAGFPENTLVVELSEDAFVNIGYVVEGQREHL